MNTRSFEIGLQKLRPRIKIDSTSRLVAMVMGLIVGTCLPVSAYLLAILRFQKGTLFLVGFSFLLVVPAGALEFTFKDQKYALTGSDLGMELGCQPETRSVVALHAPGRGQIWSSKSLDEAKTEWLTDNRCGPGASISQVEDIWVHKDFVLFFVRTDHFGAGEGPIEFACYHFNGDSVKKVFEKTVYGLENQTTYPILIICHYLWDYERECHACEHRWIKEMYEWNESLFKLLSKETSGQKACECPWEME